MALNMRFDGPVIMGAVLSITGKVHFLVGLFYSMDLLHTL